MNGKLLVNTDENSRGTQKTCVSFLKTSQALNFKSLSC